jgi:preprotein translocase subunit YajC
MLLHSFDALLAMGAPASSNGQATPLLMQVFPFILMAFVMYFVMIRPQQKRAKEHEALLKSVKSGDHIVTSGGIVGVVIGVKEKTLSVRSAETKLEILKSAITTVERETASAEA